MSYFNVKYMRQADVLPMWRKVRKHLGRGELTSADDEIFVKVCGRGWKFSCHSSDFYVKPDGSPGIKSQPCVFISYQPPGGGNLRLDSHVFNKLIAVPTYVTEANAGRLMPEPYYQTCCPELISELSEALHRHGHPNRYRLSQFESLSETAQPSQVHALLATWSRVKSWFTPHRGC